MQESNPGFILRHTQNEIIIWGNKFFDSKRLLKHLNLNTLNLCRQVHSNNVVVSDQTLCPEADGHFTKDFNQAIGIRTADCLPIFLCHPRVSFALHAGWKGIKTNIIAKGLKYFDQNEKNEIKLFIGPHIQKDSFEVQQDVLVELFPEQKETFSPNQYYSLSENKDKFLVDLKATAINQAINLGVNLKNIFTEPVDTLKNENWNSYRRDKNEAGRNISILIRTRNIDQDLKSLKSYEHS